MDNDQGPPGFALTEVTNRRLTYTHSPSGGLVHVPPWIRGSEDAALT